VIEPSQQPDLDYLMWFIAESKNVSKEQEQKLIEQTDLITEVVTKLMTNRIEAIQSRILEEEKANCLSLEQEIRILKEKLVEVEKLKNEFIYHKD